MKILVAPLTKRYVLVDYDNVVKASGSAVSPTFYVRLDGELFSRRNAA